MRKLAILASVTVLAASSTNCSTPVGAVNDIVPSGLVAGSADGADTFTTNAAGGQGKGKGNAPVIGSTIDLAMVDDVLHDGFPNWGDTVTFNVSTTATQPFVSLLCTQNGVAVYNAMGDFSNGNQWPFPLSSPAWQSGEADCDATLIYQSGNNTVTLAARAFHVAAE